MARLTVLGETPRVRAIARCSARTLPPAAAIIWSNLPPQHPLQHPGNPSIDGRFSGVADRGICAAVFRPKTRVQQRAEHSQAVANRDRAKAALDSAGTVARSSAEIQPTIDGKLASRRDLKGCDAAKPPAPQAARSVCADVATLKAELARAERIEGLKAHYEATEAALANIGGRRVADPGAPALSSCLSALGVNVSAETLGDYLVLVAVVALEIGSTFAALLVAPTAQPHDAGGQPFIAGHAACRRARLTELRTAAPQRKPTSTPVRHPHHDHR